jgi:hypothetical protein
MRGENHANNIKQTPVQSVRRIMVEEKSGSAGSGPLPKVQLAVLGQTPQTKTPGESPGEKKGNEMKNWMDWDCESEIETGEIVFCASVTDCNNGISTLEASHDPSTKNLSGEAILSGWCGQTNNINVQAIGAGIVRRLSERVNKDGIIIPRCQVERLPDNDTRVVALCEELGVTIK